MSIRPTSLGVGFAAAVLILMAGVAAVWAGAISNGDFESGNSGFTSGYTFRKRVSGPGTYTIGTNPSTVRGRFADWGSFGDHTSGIGNMFIANGGNSASTTVGSETITVTPSTSYLFSFWGATINAKSPSPTNLALLINGNSVGNNDLFPTNSPAAGGRWVNFAAIWNSGLSTSANLVLVDKNTATDFNDFALDDITFQKASQGYRP
jgi:hypothetical protein